MEKEATIKLGTKLRLQVFVGELDASTLETETPTTLVPLSPDKIDFENRTADVFFGVFHIKWSDMPMPRTYAIRICDRISEKGDYSGCLLHCSYPKRSNIPLE